MMKTLKPDGGQKTDGGMSCRYLRCRS